MSLMSSVKTINDLHIRELRKGKHYMAVAMAQVGRTIVVQLENGTYYTNWTSVTKFALSASHWDGWQHEFVRCLVALKVIKRADYDQHKGNVKRRELESNARTDTVLFRRTAKKYNVPVPEKLVVNDDGTFGHSGEFKRVTDNV